MSSYVEILLEDYKGRGLLIDANLLLLYFVGIFNPMLVGDARYKKLAKYTAEDFDLIMRLRDVCHSAGDHGARADRAATLPATFQKRRERRVSMHFVH